MDSERIMLIMFQFERARLLSVKADCLIRNGKSLSFKISSDIYQTAFLKMTMRNVYL